MEERGFVCWTRVDGVRCLGVLRVSGEFMDFICWIFLFVMESFWLMIKIIFLGIVGRFLGVK